MDLDEPIDINERQDSPPSEIDAGDPSHHADRIVIAEQIPVVDPERIDVNSQLPMNGDWTVETINVRWPPEDAFDVCWKATTVILMSLASPVALFTSIFLGLEHRGTFFYNLSREVPIERVREIAVIFTSIALVSGYKISADDMNAATRLRLKSCFSIYASNWKCPIRNVNGSNCTIKFESRFVHLMNHITGTHLRAIWTCHQCNRAFKTKLELRNHLRRSTNACFIDRTVSEIYAIIEEHEDPHNLAEVITNIGINLNEPNMNSEMYEPMYMRTPTSRGNIQR